ncbi:hypothetical protein HID58_036015 [Brassica napus]|uniref:RING-type E3 ubiquitin transferase n=1 Tax=Brassica napus TaxID=3708 RepID=A0ABQ8C6J0_BRANA|nr:hypothetical protein HID58_036015 [Brassica napus]
MASDGEGACMQCKKIPPTEESLTCLTCGTPWHVPCLSSPPESLASTLQWECPDCSGDFDPVPQPGEGSDLVAAIRAIESDVTLTDEDKAKKRQQLLSGKAVMEDDDEEEEEKKKSSSMGLDADILAALGENLKCSFCLQLLERPVTIDLPLMLPFQQYTPCGHNFCLKCFVKWTEQGKRECIKCRFVVPNDVAANPRINASLVSAIRLAKVSRTSAAAAAASTSNVYHYVSNENRPDEAFTTERAIIGGIANAASGKIYVTVPGDHFGPIPAENDPVRNQGVLVGESWKSRLACKQWGAHVVHVAGIAGQSKHGAQSVAISVGYDDDEDHGEWFLYTGSGGRDLSGNRRTNKQQSFDQKFTNGNEALRLSCRMGYPVRVVRTYKEKIAAYAPEEGVRYDGIYRVEKCWRKVSVQGKFKVCRYLFVRCDNDPAPWTSDEHGDRPRPLPHVPELAQAIDLFERIETPSWDFDEAEGCWKWMKPPPASKKPVNVLDPEERKLMKEAMDAARSSTLREQLLKGFSCQICLQVMNFPVTTPCAHNFCKGCLEGKFVGQTRMMERSRGGRTLRAMKNIMKCPCCPRDISDFLQNVQVNREVMDVIEKVKKQEEGEASSVDEKEGKAETESEENSEITDAEDVEQPRKRAKLDTEAVVSAA